MYRVVKTIKGRKYVYLQRSYRVGGKVKTESRYVGPLARAVSAVAARIPTLDDFLPDVGEARTADRYVDKQAAEAPAETAPEGVSEKAEKAE
jgi:hypothetical protein